MNYCKTLESGFP